jgi:opacity protein-like surface antigen
MKRSILLFGLIAGVLASTTAMAQSDIGLKGIGGAIGYVSPENVDGTFSIGALADLGTIAPRWNIESRLDWWSHSEEAFGAKASIRDITLGARTKYMIEVANPKLQPYVGAGLGLHFLHAETTVEVPGFPTMSAEASETKLGFDIGGGAMTAIGPRTNLMGELWYGLVTDLSQLSLRVGICQQL